MNAPVHMADLSEVVIVVPGPPAGKGRGRAAVVRGHAHVFTPSRTRTREGIVAALGMDAMAGRLPLEGPLAMTIDATMPVAASWSKRKRADALAGLLRPTSKPDLSNVWKLVEDGLNGIAYRDDAQIVESHMVKRYGADPQLVITVRPA